MATIWPNYFARCSDHGWRGNGHTTDVDATYPYLVASKAARDDALVHYALTGGVCCPTVDREEG